MILRQGSGGVKFNPFAHGTSLQVDTMGGMNRAVEGDVSDGGIMNLTSDPISYLLQYLSRESFLSLPNTAHKVDPPASRESALSTSPSELVNPEVPKVSKIDLIV
jgi:hypothetical protein